jgi:16S rRNA (adenine1518-N6/adenine1519-N6)-dimethyltransferase
MRCFENRSRNGSANKIFVGKPLPYVIEIDTESVDCLDANYPKDKIISKIFYAMISMKSFKENSLLLLEISHTIYQLSCFKTLRNIRFLVCRNVSKEVVERICEKKKGVRHTNSLCLTSLL